MADSAAPIGVFDSGLGGLSVLRALRAELPREQLVYLADSACTPYGERGDAFVRERSLAIARYLRHQHQIKALVVACNTATAAAIEAVRAANPELPVVGVEPALKPAAAATRTGRVGVIGTPGTLASPRFARLRASLQEQAEFVVQPCPGLALAIEGLAQGVDHLAAAAEVRALCQAALAIMGPFGSAPGQIDTLVLGCTHYVFAEPVLRSLLGPHVQLIETGGPVARQTRRLLEQAGGLSALPAAPNPCLLATADVASLRAAAGRWLGLSAESMRVSRVSV